MDNIDNRAIEALKGNSEKLNRTLNLYFKCTKAWYSNSNSYGLTFESKNVDLLFKESFVGHMLEMASQNNGKLYRIMDYEMQSLPWDEALYEFVYDGLFVQVDYSTNGNVDIEVFKLKDSAKPEEYSLNREEHSWEIVPKNWAELEGL